MSLADYDKYIRFGTSTWTYEGWKGTIYNRVYTKSNFKQTCLEEYAEYPLFGTVGIDHTFYGPANDETLKRYASQLPDVQQEDVTIRHSETPRSQPERSHPRSSQDALPEWPLP